MPFPREETTPPVMKTNRVMGGLYSDPRESPEASAPAGRAALPRAALSLELNQLGPQCRAERRGGASQLGLEFVSDQVRPHWQAAPGSVDHRPQPLSSAAMP